MPPSGSAAFQDEQKLHSWKEIAAYLGRDVRTVQRWEKEEGLPVHRHAHKRLHTIHAFKPEIDAWLSSRSAEPDNAVPRTRSRPVMLGVIVLVVLVAAALWYRLSLAGGRRSVNSKVVPLTTYPGDEGSGSLSPDGSRVAFSWNGGNGDNYDIYVKVLDAERPLRLTTDPAPDGFPAWSADGRSIAFGRSKRPWSPPASIYLISALGGPEILLADLTPVAHYVPLAGLAWSPDGEWLAFPDVISPDEPFSLNVISRVTGARRKLTSPPLASLGDGLPAFSPDGRMLAFVRAVSYESVDLYVMPAIRGEPVRLTMDFSRIWGLAWTEDSRELVFSSDREHEAALWRVPARGGTPQRVPDTAGSHPLAFLSRSRGRLTFTRSVSDENIWYAGVRGSALVQQPRRLIASTRSESNPQYSPDGTRIAFASDRSGIWEVWLCNRDGSDPVQLTKFGTGSSGWPSWSPDGKRIAFDSNVNHGEYHIFTVGIDEGPPRQLTEDSTHNAGPSWSTDGWIYFESNRDGGMQVWKIAPGTSAAVRVTKHGGSRPYAAPDGKYVYFARGKDEVWRIPAAGGEEVRFLSGVEDVFHGHWAPAQGGFYFVRRTGSRRALEFLDFKSSHEAEVMVLDKPWDVFALALSPDGHEVLYSQTDFAAHDLWMIENFR